ncbi:MAG: AAA-associated domain-containing protein [SAR324 cluster bacterium]
MVAQPLLNEAADLFSANHIRHAFRRPDGGELLVLDDVNLAINQREIVSLLGRSGCGKSTLLRIIAGLVEPTGGEVRIRGKTVSGPVQGIAMVFQNFALFPWLTVMENVELGLEAQGLPERQIRRRALEAIDLIGMDGFESAYPRELSGGMRQRVGFARALVVNPDILLMDEAFSSLDVLTAETLRSDFFELWTEKKLALQGVLFVSHNIEEAVLLSDRILVLASNPARIVAEIPVKLPHPRERAGAAFRQLVDDIYVLMTARPQKPGAAPAGAANGAAKPPGVGIGERLPGVSTSQMTGLLEALAVPPYNGRADLPQIAEALQMEVDDLFPIVEALQLVGFADVAHGDIQLTPAGKAFVDADNDQRKRIFAEHLSRLVGLARHIRQVLDERPGHKAPRVRFLAELEDHLSEDEAEKALDIVIAWGRYAELFSYDDLVGVFNLENPTA